MKTFALLEGWAGGPKLSQNFRSALAKKGFVSTKDTALANIVIAHSTGCYFLPKNLQASLVVVINPPYWPGQSIIKRQRQMSKNEYKYLLQSFGHLRLLHDRLWQFFYLLTKPAYTISVARNQSNLDFLDRLHMPVLFIRNAQDEFCTPEIQSKLKKYKRITYTELLGYHSDYYNNPAPYVELIESRYGRG